MRDKLAGRDCQWADLATHRDVNGSFEPVLSSKHAVKQARTSSLVNGIIILHSRRYVGVYCIDIQSRSNIDFLDHSILIELLSKGYRTCILLFDPECIIVA